MERQIDLMIAYLKEHKEKYNNAAKKQYDFWIKDTNEEPPLLLHTSDLPPIGTTLDSYNTLEIQSDNDKMLHTGLKSALTACGDSVPSVRANKGCGVYANLFGVKSTYFVDKMPWVLEHLSKKQIMNMEPYHLKFGEEFEKGLECMEYMANRLKETGCRIFPLDLQGAVDTAHIVYGDNFFYDLYDDPSFIHHLMNLSVASIINGCEAAISILDKTGNTQEEDMRFIPHYNNLIMPKTLGGIKFSEDTTTLLNPDQIDEFAIPYLNQLLKHFKGGYVHYCGKNAHLYEHIIKLSDVHGINFGNPEMHDVSEVLSDCIKYDKVYYGDLEKCFDTHNLHDYFCKVLKASYTGKSFKILLVNSCMQDNITKYLNTWKSAVKDVIASSK